MPTLTGTPYQELVDAIANYYGSGSDQWLQVAQYGTSADDFVNIVNQLPNYQVITNKAGDVISYQKIDALTSSNIAGAVDSNVVNTSVKMSTPGTVTTDVTTGNVVASKGIATSSGLQFVTRSVIPAIAAAGVGITLGKTIDSALYNANPDFWDSHGMGSLNPETWASITADMSGSTGEQALATAFNLLFGIDPNTNKGQAYIDQNALAYLALYMQNQGVFDTPGTIIPPTGLDVNTPIYANSGFTSYSILLQSRYIHTHEMSYSSDVKIGFCTSGASSFKIIAGTENVSLPYIEHWTIYDTNTQQYISDTTTTGTDDFNQSYTYNNKTVYYRGGRFNSFINTNPAISAEQDEEDLGHMAWAMVYGEAVPSLPGIGSQPNAILPNLAGATTIAGVLSALQAQYPDIFNNAVTYPVLQPDGTTTNYTYVPIALPTETSHTATQPTGSGEDLSQAKPGYDPSTMPSNVWDDIWNMIKPTPVEDDTPTDTTGDGETPAVVPPTGSASALWKIYNPSQSQLDTFGAWLWSSNFVDQILKLFNDPMQAIIGLHKIFVNPPISGSGAIKVGYLVSDASANYVSGQYVDVNCGTVSLNEYFNNVFDYEGTQVSIYLPFSGIHRLNVNDVMRGDISVVYHVDVLTGACLIEVQVMRDLAGGTLYTFSGNCAVQYPVSSGSYVGIVTGLLGIAGGIAGTIATGGALAPMLMGAGASVGRMHTDVSHSGNISSNAGAMGSKIPYLIIERPQVKTPITAVDIEGLPQNEIVYLSSVSGFVRVKTAHYENISCTSDEQDMIRALLETGIYII